MSNPFSHLRYEPAAILLALNSLLAVFLAWGATPTTKTTGIVLTASTAGVTLLIALLTRPWSIALLKGGATAVLVAFAAFGLHLAPVTLTGIVAVLSILLGLLLRANLAPVVTPPAPVKAGVTGGPYVS